MSDMPEGYADDIMKSRRLAILRVLKENEGSANESVLRVALHQLGFRGRNATDEAIRADGDFLYGAGLANQEFYRGSVLTLSLTKRGVAFLARRVDPVPGISYPEVA